MILIFIIIFILISEIPIPEKLLINANLIQKLRYGENPHQLGAIYSNEEDLNLKKLKEKI